MKKLTPAQALTEIAAIVTGVSLRCVPTNTAVNARLRDTITDEEIRMIFRLASYRESGGYMRHEPVKLTKPDRTRLARTAGLRKKLTRQAGKSRGA